ncbi:MAG: UDP-N-acetylmuramoyl-tripeptide--D-alanyl-D-alanine ligase [Deltaproteobacteria bacterium]|nr:UDP-N-acetylmuramoyl-tripeptide--D-alanyl-D-alanine ligase [Deltaproteobacteria bacterium]
MATPIPNNAARYSLRELLAVTGGTIRGPLEDAALEVVGISTDSRSVRVGQAFVALRGERFDGHEHLDDVARRGASLAVVERDVHAPGLTVLRVASTLEALGRIAAFHLARWRAETRGRVIAITGSAGKTTTKRAVSALLEARVPGRVRATAGNLNNLVGVPMTVLTLGAETEVAVIEMGTNATGEIAKLARIARPDVAVLTLIASAHSEGLGGLDGIEREKTALFRALDPQGVAIGNVDNARVARGLAGTNAARCVGYGTGAEADYRVVARRMAGTTRSVLVLARPDAPQLEVATPLLGEAGALATAAAVATVDALFEDHPLSASEVEAALSPLAEEDDGPGRMKPRELAGDVLVLDDSYNANPASCRLSIASAAELAASLGRPLVLVLGEMRELGHDRDAAHTELGEHAAASGARLLVAVGEVAELTMRRAKELGLESRHARNAEEAARIACEAIRSGEVVLVKGSRGVRTEAVVGALAARGVGPSEKAGVSS